MKHSRLYIIFFLLLVLCFFVLGSSIAQGEPGCDPFDPACPIDGGLSLLIAAGIGLGAKKAYQQRKKSLASKEV